MGTMMTFYEVIKLDGSVTSPSLEFTLTSVGMILTFQEADLWSKRQLMTNEVQPNLTNTMSSLEAGLCRERQPMSNEGEPNLTIFFRCFLNTPEGMDGYLGFSGTQ